jgi:HEAT repeat protein
MNRLHRFIGLVLLATPFAVSPANSAELKLPRDGWVSWQVPAVDGASAHCCWSNWQVREASPVPCKLDSPEGYGLGGRDATTDSVKIYVRTAGGRIDRLQALAASCAVESNTPIQELGSVAVADSAQWLIARARENEPETNLHRPIGESALAALALHRGDLARDALAGFTRDSRVETRKSAVFWLALLRGAEGADITRTVMFDDQNAEVRKHAAFAMSQSRSPGAASDLIRQGTGDKVGDVRAQAWFWLAQTGAAEAEQAIAQALGKDADERVREQAIFALSQLPDERATRALIRAAEDRSLSREQRKRAVFWLAQSEADSAQAYMEKVLARNTD